MLPYLSQDCPFPSVKGALPEPNGLLAAGADLSAARLIYAYSKGIFPWYSPGEPILWWSPDPRTVFFVNNFKVNKSVRKTLRKLDLTVSLNTAFERVMNQCAQPRGDNQGTWISLEMINAYSELHRLGHAHSVEVWQQDKLVGGIYGVASGGIFCGESMFSAVSNGSKIALTCLAKYLKLFNFQLIDCQVENPHLTQLHSTNISRALYLELLDGCKNLSRDESIWSPKPLDWESLLSATPSK